MNSKILRLGIIGESPGNGHPFSWSAIINGYNTNYMQQCGYPVICSYLSRQTFPEARIPNAKVTHVYSDNQKRAELIAKACHIEDIVDSPEQMIPHIDALLLARDDFENHFRLASPFLNAGIPVYIDKPIALSVKDLDTLFALDPRHQLIFSCSALRYANELRLNEAEKKDLGEIKLIDAQMIKDWEHYGVHLVDPVLQLVPDRGQIKQFESQKTGDVHSIMINWESGLVTRFLLTGTIPHPMQITVAGLKSHKSLMFIDTFNAFKNALSAFLDFVRGATPNPDYSELKSIVKTLEVGRL